MFQHAILNIDVIMEVDSICLVCWLGSIIRKHRFTNPMAGKIGVHSAVPVVVLDM